ncbi:chromodomain-helicase-DNA-binding protein 1-like isoform X1 [Mytilus galloprovincialis]|uniref:chromodomain-helicase-DNA-binding protein 1-like isoform X1 n=1 Tax=Mytilus galloprovincialis TaxID=29158 RepID=UPI003F7C9AA7
MDKGDLDDDFSKPLFGRPDKSSKLTYSSESGEEKSASGSGNNSSESGSESGSGSSKSDSSSESGSSSDSNSKSESESDNRNGHNNRQDVPMPYDTDSQQSSPGKRGRPQRQSNTELKEILRENPDLFGLRRSGRARQEPVRYNAQDSDEDSEPRSRKGRRRKNSGDWNESGGSNESSSGSEDYRPPKAVQHRPVRRAVKGRRSGRSGKPKSAGRPKTGHLSDSDSWSDDDARKFETRNASKKVSYKEESDDVTDSDDVVEVAQEEEDAEAENRETVERVYKTRMGKKLATGSRTTIYNVLENGDPNDGCDPSINEVEQQFLIKWKNWANIHNTWETYENLKEQKVNGLKKLENYLKNLNEINEWKRLASPEDVEYYELQKEMMEDLYEQYINAERIITHSNQKMANENNGYPDYFVKWQGLPYSDCTWEDGELLARRFQSIIDEYHARNKSQKTPSKLTKCLKYRPKYQPFKDQPSCIGGVDNLDLRDYQLEGVNWLMHAWSKYNSSILADEMGLGKTIQTISFLQIMYTYYQLYGPFLVVVPLSTLVAWQREFKIWGPEMNVVTYLGDISSRNMIREYEWQHGGNKRLKFNVILTTYEILLKDKSFLGGVSWAALMVDEAHRLKNDDSLLYKSLFEFNTNHRLLITGTPLQNSLKELWALLHFIMPQKFDNWPDFEEKYSSQEKMGFAGLHKQLEPYLLRRVKKDVEKSLPSKTEQILRVEMSSLQKQYYKWILTKNYKALSKGLKGNASSFVNIIMELKKCCNHTSLTRPPEDDSMDKLTAVIKGSGKLILLDKLLTRLKETGHRVLIFSQMVRMLDILSDYLQLKRYAFQRLDGGIRSDIRKQALDHFNAEGSSDFCFLLSTRAGGLGVNLATADTVIIFDSDWNPQNDLQAQARAHRIGQKKQVSVYRLVTKNSVEEDIVERAKRKMVLDHLIIQRMDTTGRTVLNKNQVPSSTATPFKKEELAAILKFGAEELFKEDEENEEEPQVDIDDILNRAETRESEQPMLGDELLSQFKVVSFDNLEEDDPPPSVQVEEDTGKEWDSIIPENDRRKIEEEEEQKKLLELNLPPRSRKSVKQLQVDYDSDEKKKKKKKKDDDDEDEDDESEDEEEDEDEPKKRGRPPGGSKGKIRGFTDAEIRRFIKSFKKFGRPLTRLDAIACDAELQEKSEGDLKKLAQILMSGCEQSLDEHNHNKVKQDEEASVDGLNTPAKKKREKGPSFNISGVVVAVQPVMKAMQEMEQLDDLIPKNREEKKRFKIDTHVKVCHWDCEWSEEDDCSLLKGVYEYGMGNWEAIKMDPDFNLHDKILPGGKNEKPQAKHLHTRVEYLLKMLSKKSEADKPAPVVKNNSEAKPRKKRKPKSKAEVIEKESSDSDNSAKVKSSARDDSTMDSFPENHKKKKEKHEKVEPKEHPMEVETKVKSKSGEKPKKEKKKKKKPKKEDGPMHFTANTTPVAVASEDFDVELPDEVFRKCKEMMRPVKRALRKLDNPDEGMSEKDQVVHTKQCLLRIGDRITECLSTLNDPEKIKTWRGHLWNFVSKFTEFDARKLHKLYKHAYRKREEEKEREEAKAHTQNHNTSHQDKHKPHKHQGESDHNKHSHNHDQGRDFTKHSTVNNRQPPGSNMSNKGRDHRPEHSSSPWQHASPLQRDDGPPPSRYGDKGGSYRRSDNYQRYGGGDHSHHRFNHDRREYGAGNHYSREHRPGPSFDHDPNYRNNHPEYRERGQDFHHRSDYGQFGHRDYGGSGYNRSSHDSYSQFHPERKRKSDLSDPRVHKDPRLEGHGYPESGYSESSNDSQLKH